MAIPQHHARCPCDFCSVLRQQEKVIKKLVLALQAIEKYGKADGGPFALSAANTARDALAAAK